MDCSLSDLASAVPDDSIVLTQSKSVAESAAAKSGQEHLGYIDGLRALAALFVVAHHIFGTVPGFVAGKYDAWLAYGHFSVGVFITLSGYCLMLPVARQNGILRGGAQGFFVRRARRILPTYYAALALSLLLIFLLIGHKTGAEWDVSLPVTWLQVMSHVLLLQDVIVKSGSLDYPCWSIAVEWQIYLLFPLLLICWRKWGSYVGTAIGLIAGFAIHHLFAKIDAAAKTGLLNACPWYLGLFTLGMLGAWIAVGRDSKSQMLRSRVPWGTISIAALISVIAFCYHFGTTKVGLHIAIPDYMVGVGTACLLVALSLERNASIRSVFGWPPLVWIGTFAYSIYLMHAPLVQILWQYGIRPLRLSVNHQFLAMELIGLPLIVATCYPFFLLFERPWLVKRKNETMRQVAQDAAISPAP